MQWPKPDLATPEYRAWRIVEQQRLTAFCEFAFRLVEMTLIVGVVRFLELKLGGYQNASVLLSAIVAMYARGKAMSGLIPLIEHHELSERGARIVYWIVWALCGGLLLGTIVLVNIVVPLLAANQ